MGKKLIILSLFSVSFAVLSQDQTVIRPGLLKTTMTISPSKSLSSKNSYFYLHGLLEGYLSKKISVSGDGYFYQGMINEARSDFNYNYSLFFGFARHFTKNNLDFYIACQPGVMITKINPPFDFFWDNTKTAVNPAFSTSLGINYYVGKYMHLFAQTRLVLAEHNTDYPKNISDLRFSAGLGFNFNSIR
jgi:hypothetical protein